MLTAQSAATMLSAGVPPRPVQIVFDSHASSPSPLVTFICSATVSTVSVSSFPRVRSHCAQGQQPLARGIVFYRRLVEHRMNAAGEWEVDRSGKATAEAGTTTAVPPQQHHPSSPPPAGPRGLGSAPGTVPAPLGLGTATTGLVLQLAHQAEALRAVVAERQAAVDVVLSSSRQALLQDSPEALLLGLQVKEREVQYATAKASAGAVGSQEHVGAATLLRAWA